MSSSTSEMPDTVEVLKLDAIKQWLREDLKAADVKWSLFLVAANSYRHDTVLRPFPPMCQKNGGTEIHKDFKRVIELCSSIPPLSAILSNTAHLSETQIELLHWALQPKTFTLQTCPADSMDGIQTLTKQLGRASPPHHIFEVKYNSSLDEKFVELRGDRELLYGYHGSRVENFHSIVHNGLINHMSKNAIFGEGTYLSAELSITMPYAPTGTGWRHSILGQQLSCVAVCEIIDDLSVKTGIKDQDSRNEIQGSMGGKVPEKYFVVRNDKMLRVKYLLVYVMKKIKPRNTSRWPWLARHRFAVIIAFYVIILVLIGTFSSQSFKNMLSLTNRLKPGVKSRMKMYLEQHRQAMLQLHLSDQQLYCKLRSI